MNTYLEQLNEPQRKAVVNTEGASLVIAGAGSGKTRVLTYRIAHLLKKGIPPYNILALTFTNKAAREMKERIADIAGKIAGSQLWMGTFHSIFARILRTEAAAIGYTRSYTIYDSADSKSLLRTIIKDLRLDAKVYKVGEVLSRISKAKNNLISPAAYAANAGFIEQDKNRKQARIVDIYARYSRKCLKANAMDFDDILVNTNILLKNNPQILAKYQDIFRYILVDEYQDTNHAQYLIIKMLAHKYKNICVVGDDAQSIYSFRGANISNILNFKNDYKNYQIFKLEQNYRSTQNIVEAANSVIAKNRRQIKKRVFSENESGNKIGLLENLTDREEGLLVTNLILDTHLRDHHLFSDFAILYRTNAQSRIFEESLRKRNIPYRIYGGLSFYQRKEIKDLLSYFRLIVNQNDDEALKRIVNFPRRGIGNLTLSRLEQVSENQQQSIWQSILKLNQQPAGINKGTIKKLHEFAALIQSFAKKLVKEDAYTLAQEVAKKTNILKLLYEDKAPEGVSRYENVQELLNGIQTFVSSENPDNEFLGLENFLEDVALLTDADKDDEENKERVSLMTVHAAKGLEFKNVFVVGLEEELFPSGMSTGSQQELEEERRLFYVAITRAELNLWLSYAKNRFRWGDLKTSTVSRFVREIDPRYLDTGELPMRGVEKLNKPLFPKRIKDSYSTENKPISRKFSIKPKTTFRSKDFGKTELSANFKADNPSAFRANMQVEHPRFGIGKILTIEGSMPNTKAQILFNSVGQKLLLLKFAKLKIVKA